MQQYNKKLLLTLFLQKQKTASITDLHEFAKSTLGLDNKKYLYSAYLYPLLKQGIITRVRRGLYSIVDVELEKTTDKSTNPYLLATKLRDPYYLGYSSALQMHGSASILFRNIIVCVEQGKRFSPVDLDSNYFISSTQETNFFDGVITQKYQGEDILISSKARTFIEVIDRPHLAGGWEEVIRSLDILCQKFSREDVNEVVVLLKMMGNKSLTAKVGYVLELFSNMGSLNLSSEVLSSIQALIHNSYPFYLVSRKDTTGLLYHKDWHLYVPNDFQEQYFDDQRL